MKYIIIVLIAYLLGSFCASIPLSKRVYGADVRKMKYIFVSMMLVLAAMQGQRIWREFTE